LENSDALEETNSSATEFLNYRSALNEGRCRRTISTLPNRGTTMSMIEELKARTEPLNVKEVAQLLGVAESTVQRWVRNRELPAIRVADTIRFDPRLLAERLERIQSIVETKEGTEDGGTRADSLPGSNTVSEG
jgi:excisionase family DNA binding protein